MQELLHQSCDLGNITREHRIQQDPVLPATADVAIWPGLHPPDAKRFRDERNVRYHFTDCAWLRLLHAARAGVLEISLNSPTAKG